MEYPYLASSCLAPIEKGLPARDAGICMFVLAFIATGLGSQSAAAADRSCCAAAKRCRATGVKGELLRKISIVDEVAVPCTKSDQRMHD